jgi:hypothetical protein
LHGFDAYVHCIFLQFQALLWLCSGFHCIKSDYILY